VHGADEAETLHTAPLVATRTLLLLDDLRVPYSVTPRASARAWHEISAGGRAGGLHWWAAGDQDAGGYTLGDTPIWGRVAEDRIVAEYVAGLDGDWRRDVPVLGPDGERQASVWRTPEGDAVMPFDPDELVANLRSERYRDARGARGRFRALSRRGYYALKPALPHRLQIALRRVFARKQGRTSFPRWPVEPALHDLVAFVLGCLADVAREPVPYLAPWPAGRDWALVLTHDVESAAGRDGIGRVRAIEQAAGYRSCWNLVPERYRVDDGLVAELRAAGNEVGVPCDAPRAPSRDPPVGGSLGSCRLPVAGHASPLGMDADARLRLRLVLSGLGPVRAHARRMLLVASVLQSGPGRAAHHACAGPHGVRHPAA
jgi:hypothetical protein